MKVLAIRKKLKRKLFPDFGKESKENVLLVH